MNHDRSRLRFGTWHQAEAPLSGTTRLVDVVDGNWINLRGAGYGRRFREIIGFYERIAKAAEEGATPRTLAMNG